MVIQTDTQKNNAVITENFYTLIAN